MAESRQTMATQRHVQALVPVKTPAKAKSRLAPVLDPAECAQLCRVMLDDVLAALAAARAVTGITVLTADPATAAAVRARGHDVIVDRHETLNEALDQAARELRERGVDTVLVLPADIPTVTAHDIELLLERHAGGMSVSPAIRDGGSNALVCTPPDAVPFCFGTDSARRHLQAAEQAGLHTARLPLNTLFRDIDLPDDLIWLNQQDGAEHSLTFLRESGISARLGQATWGVAS